MRIAVVAGIHNFAEGTSRRGNPNQLAFRTIYGRTFCLNQGSFWTFKYKDSIFWSPYRGGIVGIFVRNLAYDTLISEASFVEAASIFFLPGYKSQLCALWIPGRHGFSKLIFGHSFRSTIGVIHYIKSVEHSKRQFLPIRRRHGITNLGGKFVRAVFDCIVEIETRAHGYIDICLERDLCGGSAIYRHLPDFSSIGGHHKLTVWGKSHCRKHALRGNGLLLIALDRIG